MDLNYDQARVLGAGLQIQAASAPIGSTALNGTTTAGVIPSNFMPCAYDPNYVTSVDPTTDVANVPSSEVVESLYIPNGEPYFEEPHTSNSTTRSVSLAKDTKDTVQTYQFQDGDPVVTNVVSSGGALFSTDDASFPSPDKYYPGHLGRVKVEINSTVNVDPSTPLDFTLSYYTVDSSGAEVLLRSVTQALDNGGTSQQYKLLSMVDEYYATRFVTRIACTHAGIAVAILHTQVIITNYATYDKLVPVNLLYVAHIDTKQVLTMNAVQWLEARPSLTLAKEVTALIQEGHAHEMQAWISAVDVAQSDKRLALHRLSDKRKYIAMDVVAAMGAMPESDITGRASFFNTFKKIASKAWKISKPVVSALGESALKHGAQMAESKLNSYLGKAALADCICILFTDFSTDQLLMDAYNADASGCSNRYANGTLYFVADTTECSQDVADQMAAAGAQQYPPPAHMRRRQVFVGRASTWEDVPELEEQEAETKEDLEPDLEDMEDLLGQENTKVVLPESEEEPEENNEPPDVPVAPEPIYEVNDASRIASERQILESIRTKPTAGTDQHGNIFNKNNPFSAALFPFIEDKTGTPMLAVLVLSPNPIGFLQDYGKTLDYETFAEYPAGQRRMKVMINLTAAGKKSLNNGPQEKMAVAVSMKQAMGTRRLNKLYITLLHVSIAGNLALLPNIEIYETSFTLALQIALSGARGKIMATGACNAQGSIVRIGDAQKKLQLMQRFAAKGGPGAIFMPKQNFADVRKDEKGGVLDATHYNLRMIIEGKQMLRSVLFVESIDEAIAFMMLASQKGQARIETQASGRTITKEEMAALINQVAEYDETLAESFEAQYEKILVKKGESKYSGIANLRKSIKQYLEKKRSRKQNVVTRVKRRNQLSKTEQAVLNRGMKALEKKNQNTAKVQNAIDKLNKGETLTSKETAVIQHMLTNKPGTKGDEKKKKTRRIAVDEEFEL
jgi:hypothetical protein